MNLLDIRSRMLDDVVGGAPGAPVYHGVERPLVKGNVYRSRWYAVHVAHIGEPPFYALDVGMPLGHEVHDDGGKVDAELVMIAPLC